MSPELVILNSDGKVTTTSLIVAEVFKKRHKHVIEKIENLDCSEEFNGTNFRPIEYKDKRGRMKPAYELTRDGFTFVAMGFTGKKAAEFKEGGVSRSGDLARYHPAAGGDLPGRLEFNLPGPMGIFSDFPISGRS